MSKSLDFFNNKKSSNNAVGSYGGSVSAGAGSATKGLTFGKKAEMFDDLPKVFRQGASSSTALVLNSEKNARQKTASTELALPSDIKPPFELPPNLANNSIASGVRKLDKNLKNGNRIVQRKIGWNATPDTIIVVTVERELRWRPDKKLEPASGWFIENRRRYKDKRGVSSKRSGLVRETPESSDYVSDTSVVYENKQEVIPDAFVAGADAMSFLPIAVRGDIVTQIPNPNYFDGRLLGSTNPQGELVEYEVSLLRMNDDHALVVNAVKKVGDDSWRVVQAKYELTTPEIESA